MRFADGDYAELLGLYLGDGHISTGSRAERLRIFLDSKYPIMNHEIQALLTRCFPANVVGKQLVHGGTMTVLYVYSSHLSCLLPQAGPGPKHKRVIELEPWQIEQTEHAPWQLLRGLIRTDGCNFINRTGPYEYLSFHFCNCSEEIIRVFEAACDRVGVRYRTNLNVKRQLWEVRINRRDSVALVCEHVGLKA